MRVSYLSVFLVCLALAGCNKPPTQPASPTVATINDYEISLDEFERGFEQSAYAAREDKAAARKEYLDNLINRKLILQDAQKKNLDKDKEFLKSIERFWEQSLLTVALGVKAKAINGSVRVPEEEIRKTYDQMVKNGLTTKTYEEMYPQIRWQASRQLEARMLESWMDGLRRGADIKVNASLLKAENRGM